MVYINECIDVNTAFKKFLQIYELFVYDPTVSEEFPMLASPSLHLDKFFQIYGSNVWNNNSSEWPIGQLREPSLAFMAFSANVDQWPVL